MTFLLPICSLPQLCLMTFFEIDVMLQFKPWLFINTCILDKIKQIWKNHSPCTFPLLRLRLHNNHKNVNSYLFYSSQLPQVGVDVNFFVGRHVARVMPFQAVSRLPSPRSKPEIFFSKPHVKIENFLYKSVRVALDPLK